MNCKFEFIYSHDGWFIRLVIGRLDCNRDSSIAHKLNIPLEEYRNILKVFGANASPDDIYNDMYFQHHEDAQNCKDYLIDRFLVMLRLTH